MKPIENKRSVPRLLENESGGGARVQFPRQRLAATNQKVESSTLSGRAISREDHATKLVTLSSVAVLAFPGKEFVNRQLAQDGCGMIIGKEAGIRNAE